MQCYVISPENLIGVFFTIQSAGSFRDLQKLTGRIRPNDPFGLIE